MPTQPRNGRHSNCGRHFPLAIEECRDDFSGIAEFLNRFSSVVAGGHFDWERFPAYPADNCSCLRHSTMHGIHAEHGDMTVHDLASRLQVTTLITSRRSAKLLPSFLQLHGPRPLTGCKARCCLRGPRYIDAVIRSCQSLWIADYRNGSIGIGTGCRPAGVVNDVQDAA